MSTPEYVSRIAPGRWRVALWVQPGAKKDHVDGLRDGRLKIRLTAPPVDNKANKAVVAFMARTLGLRPRQVALVKGHASRQKNIVVESEKEPAWPGRGTRDDLHSV